MWWHTNPQGPNKDELNKLDVSLLVTLNIPISSSNLDISIGSESREKLNIGDK